MLYDNRTSYIRPIQLLQKNYTLGMQEDSETAQLVTRDQKQVTRNEVPRVSLCVKLRKACALEAHTYAIIVGCSFVGLAMIVIFAFAEPAHPAGHAGAVNSSLLNI